MNSFFTSFFKGDAAKGDKDDLFLYDSEAVDMAAAFLGPTLWDRTLPSDSDLKLEYMDIDEFLAENGIQVNNAEKEDKSDNVVPTIEPPLTPPDEMAPSPYRLSMTTPPQTPVMVDSQSAPDNVTIGVPATPTSPGELYYSYPIACPHYVCKFYNRNC